MGLNSVNAAGCGTSNVQSGSYEQQMTRLNDKMDSLHSTIKEQAQSKEDLEHAAKVKKEIAQIKEEMAQLAEKNGDTQTAAALRNEKNIILSERDQCLKEYNQASSVFTSNSTDTSAANKSSIFTQNNA